MTLLAGSQWALVADVVQTRDVYERSELTTAAVDAVGSNTVDTNDIQVTFQAGDSTYRETLVVAANSVSVGATIRVRFDRTEPSLVWEEHDEQPLRSNGHANVWLACVSLLPTALVGSAMLRGNRLRWLGARELLTSGAIESGIPPAGSDGLTVWEGRLEGRTLRVRPPWSGPLTRTMVRFASDSVVGVDNEGAETAYEWGSAEAAVFLAGTIDREPPARDVVNLARLLAGDDRARRGLDDPARVVAFQALSVWRHPSRRVRTRAPTDAAAFGLLRIPDDRGNSPGTERERP